MPVALLALAFFVIVLVFGAPVWSAFIASAIAEANGCTLNEGSVNTCVVFGTDVGDLLYTMFVLAWFGLLTLPIGALALLFWLVATIVLFVRSRL